MARMDESESRVEIDKFAVIGSPISHSKSPLIHRAAYQKLGLHWKYEAIEVQAEGFKEFMSRHHEFQGLSVTMPLKELAYEFVLEKDGFLDDESMLLQAGNTIVSSEGSIGLFNTDVFGVQQALKDSDMPSPSSVALLGSGATSRSTLFGTLKSFDSLDSVSVFSRNHDSAMQVLGLIDTLGLEITKQWLPLEAASDFGGADLTINTLPGSVSQDLEVDVPLGGGWIFDVNYDPWPSRLASAWQASCRISGIEMLLWQALAQIRIFVNHDPQVALDNEVQVFAAMRSSLK